MQSQSNLQGRDSTQPALSGVETPVRIPARQALQRPLGCELTDVPCGWTGCDSVRRGQPHCTGSSLTGEGWLAPGICQSLLPLPLQSRDYTCVASPRPASNADAGEPNSGLHNCTASGQLSYLSMAPHCYHCNLREFSEFPFLNLRDTRELLDLEIVDQKCRYLGDPPNIFQPLYLETVPHMSACLILPWSSCSPELLSLLCISGQFVSLQPHVGQVWDCRVFALSLAS